MFLRYLLLFLGVLACATSALFIRESTTDPFVLTALRLVIASFLLAPVFLLQLRRHPGAFTRHHLRRTHLPALVLALHLITWTLGARMTAVAQATLIVNLVPIALPFFLLGLAKEQSRDVYSVETLGGELAPRLLYRVHPDGTRQLVRGAVFDELDNRSLRSDIIAAGGAPYVSNSLGIVPVTTIAPSLLFDDISVKRATEEQQKLPYYAPPALASKTSAK